MATILRPSARTLVPAALMIVGLALAVVGCTAGDPAVSKAQTVLQQTSESNQEFERYALSIATGTDSPEAREIVIQKTGSENFQTALEAVNALGDDPPDEALEALRGVFTSKGGALKRQAAIQLARLGEEDALEYLRNQLADPVQTLNIPAVVLVARAEGGEEFLTPILADRIAAEDLAVRNEAYAALGEIRQPWATRLLLGGLNNERGEDRQQAIIALGRTGDPAVAGEIEPFVNTQGLVFASIEALGELGNPETLSSVQAMAKNEEARVRAYAAAAMWKLGAEAEAMTILDPLMQDPDPTVREVLADQLGSIEDDGAWSRLAALAEDSDKGVRIETMRALAGQAKPEFEAILLGAANDPEYEVATLGLNILGRVGRPGAVEQISALMDSENPYVAMSAAHAILSINGRRPAADQG